MTNDLTFSYRVDEKRAAVAIDMSNGLFTRQVFYREMNPEYFGGVHNLAWDLVCEAFENALNAPDESVERGDL